MDRSGLPVRIDETAKNQEVLAMAKEMGISGAQVPSSSLDKVTAEYLEQQLALAHPELAQPSPPAESKTPSVFKLALVQMQIVGGQKQVNLARAMERISQAAQAGARVVLLPEALTLGWTHPSASRDADPLPEGESCCRLSECARRHSVYVCAGLVEKHENRVYNAAVLLGPDGRLLLHHRKINELEIGHPYYALGNRLQVAATPIGTFGLMICADAFAKGQVITRSLGFMGADVILSPCAWAVPPDHDNTREPYGQLWRDNYGPVARDFRLWIAGASNVGWLTEGPWSGRKCIGCSLLMGPDGQQVLMGPYGHDADTILYNDIKLVPRPAQGEGWSRYWRNRSD